MPNLYSHLPNISVYAGVHHETMQSSTVLEERGAFVVEVDPINHPDSVIHTLKQASTLLLLVDPLSGEITRNDALSFARG